MLGQRRCFGHLDLRGQSADAVHDVISKAIQTRLHAEGFSYLKGAHCIGFANELLRDLQTLGESDTAGPGHILLEGARTTARGPNLATTCPPTALRRCATTSSGRIRLRGRRQNPQ